MKQRQPTSGYHHISIVTFAESALGCSRDENIGKFIGWFSQIAEASPYIKSFEILKGDQNQACSANVFFRVVYSGADGLDEVRKTPEHQKMIAWFAQVSTPNRLNVDTLLQSPEPA